MGVYLVRALIILVNDTEEIFEEDYERGSRLSAKGGCAPTKAGFLALELGVYFSVFL